MEIIIKFFFLVFLFSINPILAQEIHHLLSESPFLTNLAFEGRMSGSINEKSFHAGHFLQRMNHSRVGLWTKYSELSNQEKERPNFSNISFGSSYQYFLEDRKFIGMSVSYGSSSDRPFKDGRDGALVLNLIHQQNEKWIWLVNYSNNRAFLNNVPLPGVLFIKENTREKMLMFGFPFIHLVLPVMNKNFIFRYTALLPYNHHLKILKPLNFVHLFVGLDQSTQSYFDSRRLSDDKRTFWFERRSSIGVEKSFGPFLKIDFQSGLAFNRKYFEARSFMRNRSNIFSIKDGIFVGLNLKSSF